MDLSSCAGVDEATHYYLETVRKLQFPTTPDKVKGLIYVSVLAKEKLHLLLITLLAEGIFARKEGLWLVTHDFLHQFHSNS